MPTPSSACSRPMSIGTDRWWGLTRPAFDRLLQRLSAEPERAAREYDVIRLPRLSASPTRTSGPGPVDAASGSKSAFGNAWRTGSSSRSTSRTKRLLASVAMNRGKDLSQEWTARRRAVREGGTDGCDPTARCATGLGLGLGQRIRSRTRIRRTELVGLRRSFVSGLSRSAYSARSASVGLIREAYLAGM